jgi:major membrane immunogen (membrane-anchored lipoprotein)
MPSVLPRRLAAGLAVVATTGLLAGCGGTDDETTTAAADTTTAAGTTAAQDTSTAAGASASTGSSAYADGTYEADGTYQSPAGEESVGVSLTLADGKVTAVTVTPKATDSNSVRFQGEFQDGISSEVVGKGLDELEVSKVSGSSLTSGGFNAAVETIKAEAQA